MSFEKIVQMVTRGFIMLLMSVGFMFEFMNATSAFLASGVFGSCFVVSAGLMIEAALQIYHNDNVVECLFCIVGILLNIVMSTSALHEYSQSDGSVDYPYENELTKGIIGIVAIVFYLCDMALVFA
ncbi:unnamed protein product [Arctia plantaginis]|uniref:MARVEL domain-containing protein n=1 Tax=Arctia plantaginis TaxID=874455 RepID=A0A8S0Z452_ARCPL|nr:unnamed protein product [Arctia plantaginis]